MSEVFVTNWFTKKKEKPEKNCIELREEILNNILKNASSASTIEAFVAHVGYVLEKTSDLKKVPSDTRIPVCSLYHHLRTTAGIGVCLAIDEGYNDKKELAKVRLACLLHDIGKLEVFHKGESFTKHPEYTQEFMKEMLSKANLRLSPSDIYEIAKLAARHHSPEYYGGYRAQQPLEKLISQADTIASGADRSYEVVLSGNTLVSTDKIFPHVFRAKNGKTVVLGYYQKVDGNELDTKEDIFFDATIQGGLTTKEYAISSELSKKQIALLNLDIMQIQGFIKEAKKLPALTGGSKIIKKVCDIAKKVIEDSTCPECILYAGGGNLLALLPVSKADEIKAKIEEAIKNEYGEDVKFAIGTKKTSCAEIMGSFHRAVGCVHKEVERKKAEMGEVTVPIERISSREICEYCYKRKGEKVDGKVLCRICQRKEDFGRIKVWEEEKEEKFYTALRQAVGKDVEMTRELANIGDYIAVLMFDGNMVGRLFKHTSTPAEFNFKSEEFDEKLNAVLAETAGEVVSENRDMFIHKGEDGKTYVGIRKIYSGGDDILLIINAKGALHFARKFIEKVAEAFWFRSEDGNFSYPVVTLACGIAYARHDFPVYFLIEKAEELVSEAKTAFRSNVKKDKNGFFLLPKGALAISCITSSMPEEKDFVYVLDNDADRLNLLSEFVEHAQDKKWKTLVSYLVNFESTEEGKLNFVKFLYSHLDKEVIKRCAAPEPGGRLDVVEKIVKGMSAKEVLEYLIPMVGGDTHDR